MGRVGGGVFVGEELNWFSSWLINSKQAPKRGSLKRRDAHFRVGVHVWFQAFVWPTGELFCLKVSLLAGRPMGEFGQMSKGTRDKENSLVPQSQSCSRKGFEWCAFGNPPTPNGFGCLLFLSCSLYPNRGTFEMGQHTRKG